MRTASGLPGALLVLAFALAAPSCATTAAEGEGDRNLPTVGVGPFRKLGVDEVPGIAPFVFDDRTASFREPAVLRSDDGNGAILYVVAKVMDVDVIVRTRSDDARAFYGTTGDTGKTAPVVLSASLPWEGKLLSGPSALRVNGEIFLYYAAAGGVGVARSTDGLTFRKEGAAILSRDPKSKWEATELRAPTVTILPDGRFRMFYASGVAIGEAESTDGVHFQRVDPDPSTSAIEPVLVPAPPAPAGSLLPNEKPPFDTARVGDPCASVRITPADRLQVLVLYTGADETGATAIGFAARYGDSGPLVRQPAPVYSVSAKEAAPALLELEGGAYLYVQQDRRIDATLTYPAIAAAFAPGTVHLPMPADYPETP
jgi:hypothetical protein